MKISLTNIFTFSAYLLLSPMPHFPLRTSMKGVAMKEKLSSLPDVLFPLCIVKASPSSVSLPPRKHEPVLNMNIVQDSKNVGNQVC